MAGLTLAERTKAAPVAWTRAAELVSFAAFAVVSLWWVDRMGWRLWLTDAELYRGAGQALLEGRNPWTVGLVMGDQPWHFGSFPPTVLVFVPFGLLPPAVFAPLWLGLTLAAAVYIVRALGLPAPWLLYPPMVFAVILGNPIVVSMALVLAGRGVLAVLVRPQHALVVLVRSPRSLVPLALVGLASLALMPYWIGEVTTIAARYADESGSAVNAWGSWWFVPVALVMVALARRDLTMAAWLAPMALGPAVGWYAAMALMVTRRPLLAAVGALPIPGAMALAAVLAYVPRNAQENWEYSSDAALPTSRFPPVSW